jgi:hypothetical protein
MADPDRRTAIYGDQIADHTIKKEELEPETGPKHWQMLAWHNSSGKMKWLYNVPPVIFD